MHPYATNTNAQPRLTWLLFVLAGVIASTAGYYAGLASAKWGVQIGAISGMTVYGILHWAFDRWVWQVRWLRSWLLVPNLNGTWSVTGQTLFKNGEGVSYPWQGTITIRQSWSRIIVDLRASKSGSRSVAASLYHEPAAGYRLMYHYDNQPSPKEPDLKRHKGFADILFSESLTGGSGQYFTDKDRVTLGEMTLVRKEKSNAKN